MLGSGVTGSSARAAAGPEIDASNVAAAIPIVTFTAFTVQRNLLIANPVRALTS
jgi:hypothetical protein